MGSVKVTVRILKADGGGHMQRIWDAYSIETDVLATPPFRLMGIKDCFRLLSDIAGADGSSLDIQPLFEQYAKVESSLQSAEEAQATRLKQELCIGWRVFPSLLADLAAKLYAGLEQADARQRFMKNNVLPLSESVANFSKSAGIAASQQAIGGDAAAVNAEIVPREASPKKGKFEHVQPRYMLPVKPAAPSSAEDGVDARPHSVLTPAQLDLFLARQAKAADARLSRVDAIVERAKEEEEIAWRGVRAGPTLSNGTRRILKRMGEELKGDDVGGVGRTHLAGYLPVAERGAARAAGHGLYEAAMRRYERKDAAVAETMAEEERARNSKRSSTRSDAMVRRRLCRELAAATVYVAAQRANIATAAAMGATADGSAPEADANGAVHAAYALGTESGTLSGQAELIPWWLMCLTPGEVTTVLHHTGFMTGTLLEPTKAALVLTHADAFVAFSRAVHEHASNVGVKMSGVIAPTSITFFAQAVAKYLPEGVTVSEAEQVRQLSMVWRAACGEQGGVVAGPHTYVPAVRLLALLQSLVTGAYDVRTDMLAAAAKDIGMARPLVLVMPLPTLRPSRGKADGPKVGRGSTSPRAASVALSHVEGAGRTKSVAGLSAASGGITGTASVAAMSFNPNATGGGNMLMRAYSTTETHADSLVAATRLSKMDSTHAALGMGLDLGIVRSPRSRSVGLHPDVPSIFHAALSVHMSRLNSLGTVHEEEGPGDALMDVPAGAVASKSAPPSIPDPPLDSFTAPPLAAEVLQARVTFAAAALLQLKMLYSNRLAFLTTLTRTDGRRVVAAAASRDVIEQTYKPRGPGVREELGNGYVRALYGNDNDAPDLADEGLGFRRSKAVKTGAHLSAFEECTFAPALCKRSLDIADKQSAALGSGQEEDRQEEGEEGDNDSVEPHAGFVKPKASAGTVGPHLRREVLMMRYKANVEARNAALRKVKADAEVAGCTFQPNTSASSSYRSAQASDIGSSSRLYVPNYKTLVQVALNSVPLAAQDAAVRAEADETPWVTRAAPLDALAMTTGGAGSRHEWLYHLAAIQKAAVEHAVDVRAMALKSVEMSGCTFKPVTNWGRTRGSAALQASQSRAMRDAGAVTDAIDGEEDMDELDDEDDEDDELVQVAVPLTLGTDAALVLAQPDGPALQPHLHAVGGGKMAPQVNPVAGTAIVTVSKRLASAKGLDGHLSRVLRGRAEKDEQKRLNMALSAGVLHKKAIVRDEAGNTIVKPFAFVASFRKLAHEGYISDDVSTAAGNAQGARTPARRPATATVPSRARAMLDLDSASASVAGAPSPLPAVPASPEAVLPPLPPAGEDGGASVPAAPTEAPLMFVDVTVAPGQVERLPVWIDTDLAALAVDFANKHSLAKRTARRLEKMMTAQRDAVLQAPAPDASAVSAA